MDIKTNAYEILAVLSGINIEDIKDEDALIADLGLDSLGLVELLIEAEECFGISICESDMDPSKLKTVSDFVSLTEKYSGDKV
jgi:acyl carrier protein